jgi:hypothetical protein
LDFIASTVSLFVIVPILSLIVSFFILKKVMNRPKKAFLLAADITTFFLIYSVYSLALVIWGYSIGWWVLLTFFVIFLFVATMHWLYNRKINMKKSLRIAWRFHFIFYLISHVSLFLYGMIERAIQGY